MLMEKRENETIMGLTVKRVVLEIGIIRLIWFTFICMSKFLSGRKKTK